MNSYESAERALMWEIEHNFQRGKQLTWFVSRLVILTFLDFPRTIQRRLASILPTGARFSGPHYEAMRNNLPAEDRELVEQFNAIYAKRMDTQAPKDNGFSVTSVEPFVIWAHCTNNGVEHVVEFDCLSPYVLKYTIAMMIPTTLNTGEVKLVPGGKTSYLQSLGLGPSGWFCGCKSDAESVATSAIVFCKWHLDGMRAQ